MIQCYYRKSHTELNVTIGACSLITPEPEEQSINIADLILFADFDPVSLNHDIALIEVHCTQTSLYTHPISLLKFEITVHV